MGGNSDIGSLCLKIGNFLYSGEFLFRLVEMMHVT